MKDILPNLEAWKARGDQVALATVTKTWGSSPRAPGSKMAINQRGEMIGSVSGGCVEGAVLKESESTTHGTAVKTLRFGVSDNDAWSVGLTCGGTIEIFLEKFLAFEEPEVWKGLRRCLVENTACVLLSKISGARGAHLLVMPDGSTLGRNPSEPLKEQALRSYRERTIQLW